MCFGNTTISQFTVVPNTATLQYAGMRQRIAASRMRVTMARSQSIRTVSQCADKTSSVQSSFLSMSDLARDIALANTNHLIGVVRTFSANRNFLSRLDNLDEYSKPAGCFEERSFSIWKLDVDRRAVQRPVVHWTSDLCFEDRSSGCSLSWSQIGWDTAGCHVRKLCNGAVDRKKCKVRRTAPSPDLPPVAVPECVPEVHDLDIFCLDKERDLRVTQAINGRQSSHGEWPGRDRFIQSSPHDDEPIARDLRCVDWITNDLRIRPELSP